MRSSSPRAFTLLELLVVVAILALLVTLLLPALGRAKARGSATRCLANLKGIATGAVVYTSLNDGLVLPSYNMTGTGGAGPLTLDGWPAILDRDGIVAGYAGPTANSFFCPDTTLVAGAAAGASTLLIPTGYQDWPVTLVAGTDGGPEIDPTLPMPNFGDSNGPFVHEIRSSYWINANNPLGGAKPFSANPYYTQSVGYTFSDGPVAQASRANTFARPASLIVVADGIYAGQQSKASRIGLRHPGVLTSAKSVANAAFADGHAEPIESSKFPKSTDTAPGQYTVLAAQ